MNADSSGKVGSGSLIDSLNQPSKATEAKKKNKNEIGSDGFLQLLVTQLKNQDPLDPMKNDQFAVDLSQFSQVEQLVSINEKLDKSSSTDLGSLAAYLGREVSLKDEKVQVQGGNGGRLRFNLGSDADAVKIQLLDGAGSVVEEMNLGAMTAGVHSSALSNLSSKDGAYGFKITAMTAQGRPVDAKASVAGIVSGFVPGPDPKLLIGSREVAPGDITEVGLAPGS